MTANEHAGARFHARLRYLDFYKDVLTDEAYHRACRYIRTDGIGAIFLDAAKHDREEWLVFAGGRWVRAIWDPGGEVIVTIKPLTDGAIETLKAQFS